jgi:hypothetical protein
MQKLTRLFLLLTIIGPLHMAEQLTTSIEEFYSIRRVVGRYYALFDPANADFATVALVTIVWTACSVMLYAFLRGGAFRLVVLGMFGVFGASEVHHIVESVVQGGYDPGVITSMPYAVVGGLLVAAVWGQWKAHADAVGVVDGSLA